MSPKPPDEGPSNTPPDPLRQKGGKRDEEAVFYGPLARTRIRKDAPPGEIEQSIVVKHPRNKRQRPSCRSAEGDAQVVQHERGGFSGRDCVEKRDGDHRGFFRFRAGTPKGVCGPCGGINAVGDAIAVFVGVERVRTGEDFRAVVDAVAVGVRHPEVGAVNERFVMVGNAVAVGIGFAGRQSCRVFPFKRERRRRSQDSIRAEQFGYRNAIGDRDSVHSPDIRRNDVRAVDGQSVDAAASNLRADREIRRRRVDRVGKVVAEDAVSVRVQFGLERHCASRQAVKQNVFPCQQNAAAGGSVVPEPRRRNVRRQRRLRDKAQWCPERAQDRQTRPVRKRGTERRASRRFKRNGTRRGGERSGHGVRSDHEERRRGLDPTAHFRPADPPPCRHFHGAWRRRDERHPVGADSDQSDRGFRRFLRDRLRGPRLADSRNPRLPQTAIALGSAVNHRGRDGECDNHPLDGRIAAETREERAKRIETPRKRRKENRGP